MRLPLFQTWESDLMRRTSRRGFTLIELLVVIAIIAVLIGLLLPAVQKVRESAARSKCTNNLKQIGIAMHMHIDTQSTLPANGIYHYPTDPAATTMVTESAWSALSRILPFIEQENLFKNINFSIGYSDPSMTQVSARRVTTFICPSEQNDRGSGTGSNGFPNKHWAVSYAANEGNWLVFSKATETGGTGAFSPTVGFGPKDFTDGLSSTLAISEVKAYTTRVGSTVYSTTPPTAPSTGTDQTTTFGATTLTVSVQGAHKEWVDGKVHETGFTTTFKPNTQVLHTNSADGITYDVDFVSATETTLATDTYAAVTARSYHMNTVNALLMDGSVRSVKGSISLATWQALGSRAGKEVVDDRY